ncbi:MAG: outer membrane lipoprotein carrier protein LolA [Candidatus Tectomicrobia bacterium]|uniref:Outer membrane lipoprotein carrier protein LolA n=1 Tax=Tectimicrobiota bacterium TaxID=2528274 RepID=A0A932FVA9_UNCTE|nr:outer membrane lipoprotein carrier protein LolA [Candidatus Tectomicrobia bacterium]
MDTPLSDTKIPSVGCAHPTLFMGSGTPRGMGNGYIFLVLALTFFPFGSLAQGEGLSAHQVLSYAEGHFLKLATLQGTVQRLISRDKRRASYTYRFSYQKPDKFRIEYLRPFQGQIVSNGQFYWEYRPSRRQMVKRELSSLSEEEKRGLGITPGFGLDLVAKVPAARYDYRLEGQEGGNYLVIATPKPGEATLTRKEILVESKRWVVLAFRHYSGEGKLIAQADFSDHRALPRGIWLPLRITTRVLPENYVESLSYSGLKVNALLPEGLFTFQAPPGAQSVP